MGKIADFLHGWIGTVYDNEIEVVSTKQDPVKVRLAVNAGVVESNLGSVSYNIRRADGQHEEMAYVMGRLTADKQAGAVYIACRPAVDDTAHEVFYIDNGVAIFRVPVSAPNLGGEGGHSDTMWAPNGMSFTQQQTDGNFVSYKTTVPFSKASGHVTAVWSAWTGRI